MGLSEALTVGLAISERISKKGLRWIERQDPDLYEDILRARSGVRRKRRR